MWLALAYFLPDVEEEDTPGWLTFRDSEGHILYVPEDLRWQAIDAEEKNARANQDTMGDIQFGPYTTNQMRAIWWAFKDVDDPDIAVLTLVAHTEWEQDRD